MATVALSAGAWTAGMATADLNSLADGGQKTSTLTAPQVTNTTAGALYVQFEVVLGTLSPAAGANVIAFLIPETQVANTYVTGLDGTSAADQYRWQNYPYDIIALRLSATSGQTQRSRLVPIANERYKVVLINRAGVALAASGNQLSWRTLTETVT